MYHSTLAQLHKYTLIALTVCALTLGTAQNVSLSTEADSIGTVVFPISCAPEVASDFEHGVALLHHMMYVEARKVFQEIAENDPNCSMAHWGVAMTLFQPLWPTRPGPDELSMGWDEVKKAKTLVTGGEREKAYLAAAEAFYQNPESTDYWTRIRNFEQAMQTVYQSYPDDLEAAAFYALSLLATAPQAEDRLVQHATAAAILLDVYETQPNHPGAVHYTIHANDIDSRESESLTVVRSYDDIAPSVPHALHMPTHIFVRLGDWQDVIDWNIRSAEAALKFPAGDAISHHYLHALDYQVYAHLQRAEDERAREIMQSLTADLNHQQSFISAFHLAAVQARFYIEQQMWAEAAVLAKPEPATFPLEKFPWPMSIHHFAKGLGGARSGNIEVAQAAVESLSDLRVQAEASNEIYFANQINVSTQAVAAWIAFAEGDSDEALQMMQSAAALEASMEKHPVTPGAIQPAYELLGDMLLALNRPMEALTAYETSIKTWPNRFNTMLGAARSAAAVGDTDRAAQYYSNIVAQITPASSKRLAINEANTFLNGGE